jgi:hypothetical protein
VAVDIEIRGVDELRAAARALRDADRQLGERMSRGLRQIGERFARDVRSEAHRLPSGYAPTMAAAVRVSTSLKRGGMSLRVYAPGKGDERAVRAINAGVLRHPVFGHRARWVEQRVRPGFVDDPARRLADRVQHEIESAVDAAVATATRG